MEKRNCICFAYYGNGVFLGWYSDSFGTITANKPKVYGYSKEQIKTIKTNFSAKVRRSRDGSDDFCSAIGRVIAPLNEKAGSLLTIHSLAEKTKIEEYTDIELRVVECPEYSGPNPDYDEKEYSTLLEEEKQKMINFGIPDGNPYKCEDKDLVERYYDIFGRVKYNNWLYPDYEIVKEWASQPPTEFLKTIKPDL